jgi:hypothetical protein
MSAPPQAHHFAFLFSVSISWRGNQSRCSAALLVFRVIHTIHPAMKHLAQYRFTGESRCPRQKWIPALRRESEEGDLLNHLNGSEH